MVYNDVRNRMGVCNRRLPRTGSEDTSKTARFGVIGLGYVGLPLGLTLNDAGFDVTGIDIDTTRTTLSIAGPFVYHGYRRRGASEGDIRKTLSCDYGPLGTRSDWTR